MDVEEIKGGPPVGPTGRLVSFAIPRASGGRVLLGIGESSVGFQKSRLENFRKPLESSN
jgi:hypothetical protein